MKRQHPFKDLALPGRYKMARYHAQLEKEYEQEPEVLKIGGVPVGTLGNFSASIGKAQKQKDFQCVRCGSSFVRKVLNYTTDFPDGKNASFTLTQSRVRTIV